eukprot:2367345-Prymnesium_polylepis.1
MLPGKHPRNVPSERANLSNTHTHRMAFSASRGNPRKAWCMMGESPVMDLSDPDVAAAVADLHPQGDEPDPDALADVPG